MEERSELFGMLVDDLKTSAFLRELSQRLPITYYESHSRSYADGLISEPFKKLYFGHSRYFLSQSVFWEVAQDTGVDAKIEKCESNGFPIVNVFIGRFYLTLHYGSTPYEITCLNTSLVRKQNSAINNTLIQPSLFADSADFDIEKLSQAKNIYANIVHGCNGNGVSFDEYGFLRIAVPCIKKGERDNDKFMFVENINLYDVLQVLIENESKAEEVTPLVDVAIPKVKRIA